MDETLTKNQVKNSVGFINCWHKLPVLIQAICSGTVVYGIGTIAWLIIILLIPMPLSFIVMISIFWIYLKYFSGGWGPKYTIEFRVNNFRSIQMPIKFWKWGLFGAILVVVVIQAMLVLVFRFVEFPSEAFDLGYELNQYPSWAVSIFFVFAALAAGIFEEVGFRGYMQVPLEERYGAGIAISIVSIFFTIFHFNQAWAPSVIIVLIVAGILFGIMAYSYNSLIPSIVAHVITDIFAYSYWWSGLAGEQKLETIFTTGIDLHFVVWLFILASSIFGFIIISRKILNEKKIAA